MVKAKVIIILAVVLLLMPIASGCGKNPPSARVIVEDIFVLTDPYTLSEQEQQECAELYKSEEPWLGQRLPFNKCGIYYNEFSLKQGETVEIIVRSDVIMGPDLVNEERGLQVMYGMPSSQIPHESETGYFKQLKRVDGDWEVRDSFTATESGYGFIYIYNLARKEAWCQYAVNLKS